MSLPVEDTQAQAALRRLLKAATIAAYEHMVDSPARTELLAAIDDGLDALSVGGVVRL